MKMSSCYISFNVGTVDIQQTQIEGEWGKSLDLGNAPDGSLSSPWFSTPCQSLISTHFRHSWILTQVCPSSIST